MKKVIVCSFALASMLAGAESGTGVEAPSVSTPKATVTGFAQLADRTVVVTYSLANAPAVVTIPGSYPETACGETLYKIGENGYDYRR